MQQSQMYVPPLSKVNKILIIIYVSIFLLNSIVTKSAGVNLVPILGLSFEGLSNGLIFQLITFPFIDHGFTAMLFNALILWFIGSELENKWGAKFYLKFLGFSAIGSAIAYLLLFSFFNLSQMPLFGLSGYQPCFICSVRPNL